MAIRNSVFRIVNKFINFRTEQQLGFLNPGRGEQLAAKLEDYYEKKELATQRENIDNYTSSVQANDFEKQKFDIIARFVREGQDDPRISASDVLLQYDRVQVLQNLKMIEENESVYDPERVRYEKLKAKVLLEEPNAAEEYYEYVKDRPYLTKYEKWSNLKEKQMHQYLQ